MDKDRREIKTVDDIWEAHQNSLFLALAHAGNDKDAVFEVVQAARRHAREIENMLVDLTRRLNRKMSDMHHFPPGTF